MYKVGVYVSTIVHFRINLSTIPLKK